MSQSTAALIATAVFFLIALAGGCIARENQGNDRYLGITMAVAGLIATAFFGYLGLIYRG